MHRYEVGKLYNPNRTRWPESPQYNYIQGEHHLQLFFNRPSAVEVQAVKDGTAEFALVLEGPAIFLLYRFGQVPWGDAPFSIHMVPADQRQLPPTEPIADGQGAALTTMLIDATTGIIKVIRLTGLGTQFSNTLHQAIRDQADQPFDQVRYDAHLDAVYQQYPTTDALLAQAVVRYRVGDDAPSGRVPRGRPR